MGRFLVTGGAGLIGSNLCYRLVADGHDVRILDNLASGLLKNLEGISDRVEFVEADLRDADAVQSAVDGIEYVFHQAAIPSVQASVDNPLEDQSINAAGTLSLLDASRKASVRRFVFAASCSSYGNNPVVPHREDLLPKPTCPYAVSKLSCEHYCQVFNELYGLETVCLRYFNVFGPRQNAASPYSGVISKFIKRIRAGQPPIIFGDGEQYRDFVYVDNVVQANLLACRVKKAAGGVFNIACGRGITINYLAAELNRIFDTNLDPIYEAPLSGELRFSVADISKACDVMGYRPEVPFEEGLARTVRWVLEH